MSTKELEDDNTVIGADHILECQDIASDMLKIQDLDVWVRNSKTAQEYFEHELTKMYSKKFGGKK